MAALSFFANVLFSSFICFKSAEIRSKLVVVFFWLSISIWRKWTLMLAKPINFKPASVGPGGEGFLHWSCSPGGGRGYLNLSSPDLWIDQRLGKRDVHLHLSLPYNHSMMQCFGWIEGATNGVICGNRERRLVERSMSTGRGHLAIFDSGLSSFLGKSSRYEFGAVKIY